MLVVVIRNKKANLLKVFKAFHTYQVGMIGGIEKGLEILWYFKRRSLIKIHLFVENDKPKIMSFSYLIRR